MVRKVLRADVQLQGAAHLVLFQDVQRPKVQLVVRKVLRLLPAELTSLIHWLRLFSAKRSHRRRRHAFLSAELA